MVGVTVGHNGNNEWILGVSSMGRFCEKASGINGKTWSSLPDLEGVVLSLDSLHCQKKLVK